MYFYKNPAWIDRRLLRVEKLEDLPESIFYEINKNLGLLLKEDPLVSIVIPAYNEQVNIVRTLHSLSRNKTTFGVEIIVVNNNSTDRTQDVLNRLSVKSLFQPKQGCGPARQLGQQNAKGKYILMADADCLYPPTWIDTMTKALINSQAPCIYGRYSFLATEKKSRWSLFLYETARDILGEVRHIKRPYINSLGMSMGYVKELGLKSGFVDKKIRGEDGRMCFTLMQYGKVLQVRNRSNRVWTFPRTLDKEPSLFYSMVARVMLELSRGVQYFYKEKPHDVHTSKNSQSKALRMFSKFKNIHKAEEEEPLSTHPQ